MCTYLCMFIFSERERSLYDKEFLKDQTPYWPVPWLICSFIHTLLFADTFSDSTDDYEYVLYAVEEDTTMDSVYGSSSYPLCASLSLSSISVVS